MLEVTVVVVPEPEPQAVQQVQERGRSGAMVVIGTVGTVTAAAVAGAMQMGFLPSVFFG